MIQSLADNVHMPIAVFVSNGLIKGIDLVKIVVKSILLLENARIQVMRMTSDGATTNRNMWSWLGISAKSHNFKNSFENPFDNQCSVYVFSDALHLMKTIRNRLYTKKALKIHPTKSFIKWKVYEDLYTHDSKNITRVYPKID
ncbi:uncharacterized protein LOC113549739 [Rhopalosiphum maidis]|uniref:uncharacterized protein LOC113549739 n=1 Tax=Rhopalosiphum maidis TaxID=43146 RepID=UPI000EFE2043|nr:uncharacterized protein LOC113549739 [Rhopalosiphum maidis]